MVDHDDQHEGDDGADQNEAAVEVQDAGDAPEANAADADAVGENAGPEDDASDSNSPLGDLDDEVVDVSPEMAIAESLRTALGAMRSESDRISELGTGVSQVEAAEKFAEDAGRLDEQVGSAARRADDDDRR